MLRDSGDPDDGISPEHALLIPSTATLCYAATTSCRLWLLPQPRL